MIEVKGKYTTAKIMIDDVEEEALKQINAITNHIAFDQPISVMADVHAGKSSPIGFCMSLGEKVIPNTISSDIGCGVYSVNVGNQVSLNKDKLLKFDEKIRNVVPMGNNIQKRSDVPSKFFEKNYPWTEATEVARKFIMKYNKKFNTNFDYVRFDYEWFLKKCVEIGMRQNAELAIGSMGGNNHFISFDVSDNTGEVWITVHSGSRNFGKMICDFHQKQAKNILDNKRNVLLKDKIKEIRKNYKGHEISVKIKEAKKELGVDFDFNVNGMEFLEGKDAVNYFMDMIFTQKYAEFNRKRMIELITDELGLTINDSIHSIHNYINFEDLIIRKGAISSYVGERMVVPLTPSDGILICVGKSSVDHLYSCAHGAGRLMSRGYASRNLDLKDFKYRMKGIVSTAVNKKALHESPMAYKSPKVIEDAIKDTVTIVDRIKPILNLKDKGESLSWKERRLKEKKDKSRKFNRTEVRKLKGY